MQHRVDQVLRRGSRASSSRRLSSCGTAASRCSPVSMPERARLHAARSRIFPRRVLDQDGEKRIDRFVGAEHRQSFDGPETRLLVAVVRVAQQSRQHDGWFDTAVAECAEASRASESGCRIVVNLAQKMRDALRRLAEIAGARSISTAAARTRGSSDSRAASTRWKSRSVLSRRPRQRPASGESGRESAHPDG